jgi:hypothetical protein
MTRVGDNAVKTYILNLLLCEYMLVRGKLMDMDSYQRFILQKMWRAILSGFGFFVSYIVSSPANNG